MAANANEDWVRDTVQKFYGRVIKTADYYQSNVCSLKKGHIPTVVKEAMNTVHSDVRARNLGCGVSIPLGLKGLSVLDLGSGAGGDCFAVSRLVGEHGQVTGVDITDEQLEFAKGYVEYHTEKYGYKKPNVLFLKSEIEDLTQAGIMDNCFDVVISGCVITLSADKGAALREAYRVLKEGGELYSSDMYADQTVPEAVRGNERIWVEGLGGALYWKRLFAIAKEVGFTAPRLVRSSKIKVSLTKQEDVRLIGNTQYASAIYRLFKPPRDSRDRQTPCSVIYRGNVEGCEELFILDHQTTFPKGTPVVTSGEVATILEASRFREAFDFDDVTENNDVITSSNDVTNDPFLYFKD